MRLLALRKVSAIRPSTDGFSVPSPSTEPPGGAAPERGARGRGKRHEVANLHAGLRDFQPETPGYVSTARKRGRNVMASLTHAFAERPFDPSAGPVARPS